MVEGAITNADGSLSGWLERLAPGSGIGGGGGAITSEARMDDTGM